MFNTIFIFSMLRKHQKIKRILYLFIQETGSKLSYRYNELHIWTKISLFWIFVCILSLFFPWIESLDGVSRLPSWNLTENAFSVFAWYVWYFLMVLFLFVIFSIISKKRKERFKYFSLVDAPESILILFTSVVVIMISLQYFFIVWWYQVMSQNIIYGRGIILSTTGSLLLLLGYYYLKKTRKKQNSGSFGYENNEDIFEKHVSNPDNMKLPF